MNTNAPLKHIMIDLETLGVGTNAFIAQVGACRFDPFVEGTGAVSAPNFAFRWNVKMDGVGNGQLDASTVAFWFKQKQSTRDSVFAQDDAASLQDTLLALKTWIEEQGPVDHIWACDPTFDIAILNEAYKRNAIKSPFSFRQERSFRTIKMVGEELGVKPIPLTGAQHDALDDAFNQSYYVIEVLRALRKVSGRDVAPSADIATPVGAPVDLTSPVFEK